MSGLADWLNTNITAPSEPLTRERFEEGLRKMREMESTYRPQEHIMNPRGFQGEWTRCTCGYTHRFRDGKWWTLVWVRDPDNSELAKQTEVEWPK